METISGSPTPTTMTLIDLSYRYDPANRLIGVDQVTGPEATRPLKSFHYARNNGPGDVDRLVAVPNT